MWGRNVFVAVICVLGSISSAHQLSQNAVSNKEVMASVPDEFKPLFDLGLTEAPVWSKFPYDRIELERTHCLVLGECPAYRVVLLRGGRAELYATSGYERKGNFVGTVRLHDYGKLSYLLKQLRFDSLAPEYSAPWTDAATFTVTAVSAGKTTRVSDYGGIGPIELWAIQESIDAITQRISWRRR